MTPHGELQSDKAMGTSGDVAGTVPLVDAIEALRNSLEQAVAAGAGRGLRFEAAPIELTLQVTATAGAKGQAGIKWWLVTAGGEVNRERVTTQTVKLSLMPVSIDDDGVEHRALIDAADE